MADARNAHDTHLYDHERAIRAMHLNNKKRTAVPAAECAENLRASALRRVENDDETCRDAAAHCKATPGYACTTHGARL